MSLDSLKNEEVEASLHDGKLMLNLSRAFRYSSPP